MSAFDAPPPFGVRANNIGPEYAHVTDANGNEVATVWNVPGDSGKQAKALALLFAAAPDLLEACENAERQLSSIAAACDAVGDESWRRAYIVADAVVIGLRVAIAKAKGGA